MTDEAGYTIPLSYELGSVGDMLEAFEAEKPLPLNARALAMQWTNASDVTTEEMPRVLATAVILHANTAEHVDIWQCLYVAWIFERG